MKVSIGIPFYNPGVYFEKSILSILNQSFTDFELILLDDGSTDDSLAVAKSFNDSRIKIVHDGENHGLPYRLNQLISLSKGEYIARMDADDLVSSTRISQQVTVLNEVRDVDIVATGICSITNNNEVIGYRLPTKSKMISQTISNAIFGQSEIVHATILARKSWYLRNAYNEKAKLMEDYQLWVDATIKNDLSVAYIKKPLYFYREESSVNYKKAVRAHFNGYKMVLSRYFKYLKFFELLKITLLTGVKIIVISLANLMNSSDRLLKIRNKGTIQNEALILKLQEEVKQLNTTS